MDYRKLGLTGITVSRLCFGVLTIGPLQAGLPVARGADIIRYAIDRGVNFMDTAQYYKTYPYIREALKGYRGDVVIASKSYAYTRDMMAASVEEARKELDRDVIDIFLLHEQESELTLRGHWEAFEYLLECKQKGIIRAAGISTHTVRGVRAACEIPEIDIIHPLYNIKGIGITDGTAGDMGKAMAEAVRNGKGIYGMKALGGGNLLSDVDTAVSFVLGNNNLASIAVGMKTEQEVTMNISLFEGRPVSKTVRDEVSLVPRTLHIEKWCSGCGKCITRCSAGALKIVDGRAVHDPQVCRLCGYCGPVCEDFCIKII
ncbi:MAG: aldo/keto reductase [Firmicutes bacterium HGW-Firmicutes-14]|nr:MAG: aldo/keto reductase [Firmicutes bacterium HGW-Firmicutes-14]